MASDPGLSFQAWTFPSTGNFVKRFNLARNVESYTLNDRFSDLSDGQMVISAAFRHVNELLYIDRANHANDEGSVIRVLRGSTPVAHFVLKRIDNRWDSRVNIRPCLLEGAEYFLDKTFVPNFDYLTVPYRNPDWIYGAASVFSGVGDELTDEIQSIYREAVVNTGVFVLTFRNQQTVSIAWNATAATLQSALNDLGFQQIYRDPTVTAGTFKLRFSGETTATALNWNASAANIKTALEALSNVTTVNVSGTGTLADPWFISFVNPAGNQALLEIQDSTLNGNLYVSAHPTVSVVEGDGSASLPWTITFEQPTDIDAPQVTVFSSTLNGNLFVTTLTEGGVLDPRPFTMSFNPVTQLNHGTYDSFQMVSTPLYLDSTSSLEVNVSTPPWALDYGGAQVIVDVAPGGFYRAEIPVRATSALNLKFVINDMTEHHIASLLHTTAINTWEVLKIPDIWLPLGIEQVIFRVAVISNGNPGPLYLATKYALFAPGNEAAPLGEILGSIHDALQTQNIFTWVTRTFTDTHDSKGVPWDRSLSVGINHGQSLLQLHEQFMGKWQYRWGFDWSVANNRWEWHAYNPGTTMNTILGDAIVGRDGGIGAGTFSVNMPEATHYQSDGDGGQWGEYADSAMESKFGKLMKFYANAQGLGSDDLTELSSRLVAHASERTEGIMVELQNPDLLPWQDYYKGDVITVNLSPKTAVEALPIMGMVVTKEPKKDPVYQIHLNGIVYSDEDAIAENLRRLTRKWEAAQFKSIGLGASDPASFSGSGITTIAFSLPGQAFAETGRLHIPLPPVIGVILGVKITCHTTTPPTGSSLIVDVNKNGTTIFTTQANRPTIAISGVASSWVVPDVADFDGTIDTLTADTDQVGSTLPGGDIVVAVRIQETAPAV